AGYLDGDAHPFDDRGFFCTGDVFEWADDALQRLHHVDRAKDIVIRGGMNISAAEVEGLLAAHPKIAEVAVVGVADDVLGERVCAVVVPREGEDVPLDDVVSFMREQMVASYKLPERVEVVETLPHNAVGKVLKRELRDRLAA